jgi:hypothetical protein
MDGSRFDTLTRALSLGPSRRGILQAFIAAFTGYALGLVRGQAAACPGLGVLNTCFTDGDCADCSDAVCQLRSCRRPTGGKCRRNRQCASGSCNRNKRKCRGCAQDTIPCGGRCVTGVGCGGDVSPTHCGACFAPRCTGGCTCCAGSSASCIGSGTDTNCVCRGPNEACSTNEECCTTVCEQNAKCGCTLPDKGCVRDAQCCSGDCQPNGRCAGFP